MRIHSETRYCQSKYFPVVVRFKNKCTRFEKKSQNTFLKIIQLVRFFQKEKDRQFIIVYRQSIRPLACARHAHFQITI